MGSGPSPFLATRLGDQVLDLRSLAQAGLLPPACDHHNLDRLLGTGRETWEEVRGLLIDLLGSDGDSETIAPHLHALSTVVVNMPFTVGDYVDFYSSESHATNVGKMFRPDAEPLLPNWKQLPVGYHGRSRTVVVSGAEIPRPSGQLREADGSVSFGPTRKLDIELEMGWVVGGSSDRGDPVPISDAGEHVFGIVLLNDWSARDIQAWEYAPLGPFLGKSFATSIAGWVTPLAALDSVRCSGPDQDPEPFEYLRSRQPWAFDLELSVELTTPAMREAMAEPAVLARTNFRHMYWTMDQQLAHLTVNGASIGPGDLNGSGTISGWGDGAFGSLLELTWNGRDEMELPNGELRTFLEDGDEVTLLGSTPDGSLTLAGVTGRILAS